MPDDKIYNKVITIESKEESKIANGNTMVKIIDHTGSKFAFFKKKKDGELSSPAAQFRDMGLDEGSTVKIGYVIETYEDKTGVTRESHKIINFQETNDSPSEESPSSKTVRAEGHGAAGDESKAAFGRRLGIQGHINALLSNPNVYKEVSIGVIVTTAIQIEDEAERQINGASPLSEPKANEVAPDILEMAQSMADEDLGDDIPFK
jgi:hypothetical protein